jgi:peptidoglycan biosynthesis protein MviN/MurJ (putative lipid II flippase)
VSANILLSVVLMQTPLSYSGLALANSLAALTEAAVLAWLLSVRLRGAGVDPAFGRLGRSVVGYLAAAIPMGAVSYLALQVLDAALDANSLVRHAVLVGSVGALGALVYVALSAAFGSEELSTLLRLVRPRGRTA